MRSGDTTRPYEPWTWRIRTDSTAVGLSPLTFLVGWGMFRRMRGVLINEDAWMTPFASCMSSSGTIFCSFIFTSNGRQRIEWVQLDGMTASPTETNIYLIYKYPGWSVGLKLFKCHWSNNDESTNEIVAQCMDISVLCIVFVVVPCIVLCIVLSIVMTWGRCWPITMGNPQPILANIQHTIISLGFDS